SLRAALQALANQIGGPSVESTRTFLPNFLITSPIIGGWNFTEFGVASSQRAKGWFPVQLPDGTNITSMTVTGKATGGSGGLAASLASFEFQVKLMRRSITDGTAEEIIVVNLNQVRIKPQPFDVKEVSGVASPKFVENDKYQYFVLA